MANLFKTMFKLFMFRHQATSKHITDTAQEAFDLSRRAQELIQESIDQMEGLISSLEDLIDSE